MAGPPVQPSRERLRQLLEASVTAQFETVASAIRGCDVIVAASTLQIAARSLAEVEGIPYVFAAYCPAMLPSPRHPPSLTPFQPPAPAGAGNTDLWALDAEGFNATFAAVLNAHRASLGLARVDDVRGHVLGDGPWLAADPILAPWPEPEARAVFQPGAWLAAGDRTLPPELETFLEAGEPPVYFGFGSMRVTEGLSHALIQAARAIGRRSIVSRGWTDLAPVDEHRDCLSVGEIDHHALFPRVAAVVHHGGAGTTTAAALAGAPQVVLPHDYDQHYWAQRVNHLGIGAACPPDAPTTAALTDMLLTVLDPRVTAEARSVAHRIRTDGAQQAAERLLALVGE